MTVAVIDDAKDTEAPDAASPWLAPVLTYGCLVLACILALHPTAFEMVKTWATSSSYFHGFFVAPISLWMIISKSRHQLSGGSIAPGILITVLAAIVWLMGRAASVSLIEQIAFVGLLIGCCGVVFGARALRDWAFPLGFLFFMVPFGETLIPPLQSITAETVVSLLSVFSGNVSLDGFIISTPAAVFEVAEACAGLNFLIAAMMVAAIFSYLHFKSWGKHIAFLFFAVVIALLANAVRAFLIIAIATLTKNQWAIGPDHILIGWMFYAIVLFALISVGSKYTDATSQPQSEPTVVAHAPSHMLARSAAAALIIFVTVAYGLLVIERPVNRTAPASLTLMNAPGWRILPPPGNWRASLPDADRTLAATYARGETIVYVSAGYFTHERRDAQIVQYDNRAWDGDYWRKAGVTRDVVYLFGQSTQTDIAMLAGPERRRLAVVTAYWLDGQIYLKPWRMKFSQMKARLQGYNPSGGIVMVAASYDLNPDEALHSIRAFTVDVELLETWLERNSPS